jgi:hypothetical protein
MERWNGGISGMLFLKGNISLINFLVNRSITNSPCEISHREPYLAGQTIIPISQKPLFHHSTNPTFQLGRSP